MRLPTIINKTITYLHKTELRKRLFKGVSWILIGSVAGKFLQLISFIIVARIIGKEEYGQLGIIRSTIAMFLMFSTLGMGMTASRYIALYRNTEPQNAYKIYKFSYKVTLVFALAISLFIFLFSESISLQVFNNLLLNKPLIISTFVLFFMSITSIQSGALNGFENFKAIGINSTINGIIQLVLVVFLAFYFNTNGVIWALGISYAILFIQYQISLKRNLTQIKNDQSKSNQTLRLRSIFVNFSLPAVLSGLVTIPTLWWAKTFLIKNNGFGEMAIYDVAEQWYYVILFIPGSLSSIILPLLTNTTIEGTKSEYRNLIKLNLSINIIITGILAIFVAGLSPFIYKMYGSEFNNIVPLIVLLVSAVICAANNVLGQIIASKGKMWIGLIVNIIWGIWLILFSLIFIGKYDMGANGLAYAILTSYSLHSVLQAYVAFKIKLN